MISCVNYVKKHIEKIFDSNNKLKNKSIKCEKHVKNLQDAVEFLTKSSHVQEQNHSEKEKVIKSFRENVSNITSTKAKSSYIMEK